MEEIHRLAAWIGADEIGVDPLLAPLAAQE